MSDRKTSAVCYFLDVGQGTSNIVYLGYGRAIVIDGGRSSRVPMLFLNRYVNTIEALIVSHNDKDHQAGAFEILLNFQGRVRDLYFLEDRPFGRVGLFELAEKLLAERVIGVRRLERSHDPHVLFHDASSGVTLEILYPDFMDNYRARRDKRPNATSCVLALACGRRNVLFPGDATIVAWRKLHARFRGQPIRCDVLAVPHHGGVVSSDPAPRTRVGKAEAARVAPAAEELEWLYKHVINSDYAVLSVGTYNIYGHPREDVIDALRGGYPRSIDQPIVICTEITNRCCDDLALEKIRPSVLDPLVPVLTGACGQASGRRNRGGIACAGTIVAEIGDDFVSIERLGEHQERVDELKERPGARPACRKLLARVEPAPELVGS
jgi:beta-lactamase superfamily II metal-dependent hydrolase